jgi:hypothetical protein
MLLPLCAAAETAQMAAADPAARAGRAPPVALAALQVIAVNQDAAGILTAGGIIKGGAQCTLMPLPLCTAAETAEMAAADPAARDGRAICTDGCAGGTCGDMHARTFGPAITLAVMAPAVANPYPNPTMARMGMAVVGTVCEAGVAGAATLVSAGPVVVVKDHLAGGNVQGARGHSMPCFYTKAELGEADPLLQQFANTDQWLLS